MNDDDDEQVSCQKSLLYFCITLLYFLQQLLDAIRSVTKLNPDMTVEKVVVKDG